MLFTPAPRSRSIAILYCSHQTIESGPHSLAMLRITCFSYFFSHARFRGASQRSTTSDRNSAPVCPVAMWSSTIGTIPCLMYFSTIVCRWPENCDGPKFEPNTTRTAFALVLENSAIESRLFFPFPHHVVWLKPRMLKG